MAEVVYIDGAHGEGGGQLVRTALSLAAITGQAVHIERIRAGRKKPGLRAQHLTAVRAAADICDAEVTGAEPGSQSLTFEPTRSPQPGSYRWDVGTAGAVSLVFQTVFWPLALAAGPSEIALVGGTHVDWSPPVDYLQQVYLPALAAQVGLSEGGVEGTDPPANLCSIAVDSWGWYPRGGGAIRAVIAGNVHLRGLTLVERGALRSVSALSAASNLPDHVRQRQANRADFLLRKRGIKPQVETAAPPSPGQGTVVFVLAEYRHARAGFTSYGRLRKPAERVAEEACKAFWRYHKRGQPIDAHLADQLLLPLLFADGRTEYAVESVTRHLLTNAWVVRQFFEGMRIEIDGQEGHPGVVRVANGELGIVYV